MAGSPRGCARGAAARRQADPIDRPDGGVVHRETIARTPRGASRREQRANPKARGPRRYSMLRGRYDHLTISTKLSTSVDTTPGSPRIIIESSRRWRMSFAMSSAVMSYLPVVVTT